MLALALPILPGMVSCSDHDDNQFNIADQSAESLNTISYIIKYSKNTFNDYYDVLQARARDCNNLKGAVAYNADKTDARMANPDTGYFTRLP